MEDYAAKFIHGIADEITHFLDAPQVEQTDANEDVEVPKNVMWYNRSVVEEKQIYRMIQQDFTPKIKSFLMLFDMCQKTESSLKQHEENFLFLFTAGRSIC